MRARAGRIPVLFCCARAAFGLAARHPRAMSAMSASSQGGGHMSHTMGGPPSAEGAKLTAPAAERNKSQSQNVNLRLIKSRTLLEISSCFFLYITCDKIIL